MGTEILRDHFGLDPSLYTAADPANNRYRFAIADRFVAGAVRAKAQRPSAIADEGVVVRETLETLAFDGREAPH